MEIGRARWSIECRARQNHELSRLQGRLVEIVQTILVIEILLFWYQYSSLEDVGLLRLRRALLPPKYHRQCERPSPVKADYQRIAFSPVPVSSAYSYRSLAFQIRAQGPT